MISERGFLLPARDTGRARERLLEIGVDNTSGRAQLGAAPCVAT
jgi:hypothetical protein